MDSEDCPVSIPETEAPAIPGVTRWRLTEEAITAAADAIDAEFRDGEGRSKPRWSRDLAITALEAALERAPAIALPSPRTGPAEPAETVPEPEDGPWTQSPGVALIAVERSRQVTSEGYTPEHDAEHRDDALARAAACYATPPARRRIASRLVDGYGDRGDRYGRYPEGWPWHPDFWKPGDRIRELAKAGALIAAELDRLIAKERAS